MSDAPEIAALLGEHVGSTTERYDYQGRAYHPYICECGEYDRPDGTAEGHRRHVASVLEAHTADLVRAAAEKAWDDLHQQICQSFAVSDVCEYHDNPYRRTDKEADR